MSFSTHKARTSKFPNRTVTRDKAAPFEPHHEHFRLPKRLSQTFYLPRSVRNLREISIFETMADFSQESSSFKLFGTVIFADEDRATKSLTQPSSSLLRPACPRCKSHLTKFCYFNNYNVNQPRHFCKSCHRYWTAGGALRNVPVGAGRRRSRLSSRLEDGGNALAEGRDGGTECGVEIGRWQLQLPASGRMSSNAAGNSC